MTIEDVLKQSGLTDEQIKALDQKVIQGFTTVLTTATAAEEAARRAKDEAELANRAQKDLYANEIAPALDKWANDSANLQAELAFYKTQAEQAKAGGFIPKDAPGVVPKPAVTPGSPAPDGRFVAGANPVPGSPAYMTLEQGLTALTNATWVMNEYQRLFGAPMPDDVGPLVKEAADRHLDFRTYAGQKYGFDKKREELQAAKQKEHDDKIRQETAAAKDKEWAEKIGNNPNVRMAEPSRYATLAKATTAGQRKDPLLLTPEQRREQTRQYIQEEIAHKDAESVH